ncbi:MAG: LPS export ABC transporter permease LptG [Deltaproteobacteria bacterium]|nr:LPS export ABC transporter permease LptG [Deltaproteobacteria bacterium]
MTLFFYILRDYLKFVIGTVILTVFLFVLFDAIHKSSKDFAEYNPSAILIFRFYLYQIPSQIVQALPIAALLASVITMILMSRTNEVTAMRAAGMGAWQIGRPLVFGGLGLSLLSILVGELWAPRLARLVHHIQEVEIQGRRDDQISSAVKWVRSGNRLFNFQEYDPIRQTLNRIQVVQLQKNFRPESSIHADVAEYQTVSNSWVIEGIKSIDFRRNGEVDRVHFDGAAVMALPIDPSKLKKDRRKPNEMSFVELRELVDRGDKSGVDTVPFRVELQGKVAYPFAAFVVSLIGLKFGYRSERSTETARGVLMAFFVGISYWFVMSAARALGLQGALSPIIAAWTPNLVILSIIALDAWISRKQ